MIAIQPEPSWQEDMETTRKIVEAFESILRSFGIEMSLRRRDKSGIIDADWLSQVADKLRHASREEIDFIRQVHKEWLRWKHRLITTEKLWAEHRGLIIDLEGHDDS